MFNRKRIVELERRVASLESKVDYMRDAIYATINYKFAESVHPHTLLPVGGVVRLAAHAGLYRLIHNIGYGWKCINVDTGDVVEVYNSLIEEVVN